MEKLKRSINKRLPAITGLTKVPLLLLCLLAGFEAHAQKYFKDAIPFNNTVRFTTADSTYIIAEHTDKKYKEPLSNRTAYYWYAKDTIIQAQGTYYGKLLHGTYREFYPNRQPKVEGSFYMGKKTGVWKHWDQQGRLRKTSRWRNSREEGRFAIYNEHGELVQKGRMRKGKIREGNTLLKAVAKLKHREVHSDEDDANKEAEGFTDKL